MENRRLHGCLGTAVTLAVALATGLLLGRSWRTCDSGTNASADNLFLLVIFIPGLWTISLLAWVAVGTLLGSRPLPHAIALAVTLLGLAWCAVSIFLDGTPTPFCPDGVPPWWPGVVPAPGF
ncbi:hypothetical protein ACGFZR_03150 [Streptomyces sp. NPDC048241]|uniref:hypothetical protein n=1 Tax=Streptomyces sp. NPDC048241 TaxID=3365521 RepID=UPI003717F0A1